MSDNLVKMTRGDSVAIVRPDWVDEWRGYGYVTESEAATKKTARAQKQAEAE